MISPAGDKRLRRMERWVIAAGFAACAAFAALLAAVKWPDYWIYIASEQTPMTWLQSVLWFGCVLLALLCAMLNYARTGLGRETFLWLLLTAAFGFLMADERFAFHERVRDHVLKPAGIKILPWMEAGDFLLLGYAVIALLLASSIVRLFRSRRSALFWLIAAALLFAAAVGMDTFDVTRMTKAGERLEQSIEEIVELFADQSLLSSVLLMLTHYIRSLRS
ncbi:hypothetical protein [Paenibacillus humicola]|uniref:hypothetical protein n=1 Tax=Paenibacillus humicola TaxID=3110540 RepID=UPI00237C149D|nr:hypothetical protein [Paenibacillus humicola]